MTHPQLGVPTIYARDTFKDGVEKVGSGIDYYPSLDELDVAPTVALFVYENPTVNTALTNCYIELGADGQFYCLVDRMDCLGSREECEAFLWRWMGDEMLASPIHELNTIGH